MTPQIEIEMALLDRLAVAGVLSLDVYEAMVAALNQPRPPPMTRVSSPNALADWWTDAKPGDIAVYHTGFLAIDRDANASKLPPDVRLDLIQVANFARSLYEDGCVTLVQRPAALGRHYLAIKRGKSK